MFASSRLQVWQCLQARLPHYTADTVYSAMRIPGSNSEPYQ